MVVDALRYIEEHFAAYKHGIFFNETGTGPTKTFDLRKVYSVSILTSVKYVSYILSYWLTDWLTGWLAGWLTDSLTDWLIDWLTYIMKEKFYTCTSNFKHFMT